VSDARHLGGECGHRLAAAIRVISMAGNIATKLVAEAVVALTDGDLVAIQKVRRSRALPYLELGSPTECARLAGRETRTELEELAVVGKPAKVASFGKDGQRVDRPDSGIMRRS
jgi:hypothetical protein